MFKLGSLFDGSGTCPLAAETLGIEPVWASEIEPYPIAVTTARFPNMKHLGSITELDGAEIEPVHIVTFGSPCQDLSVAGQRKGIHEGERSNLFFEAIRIIREMREATNGKYPRFAMWENVPGAFSSNGGADFQAVLQAFVSLRDETAVVPEPPTRGGRGKWENAGCIVGDGYSIAWRVLDAQYWGVPQRRKRIFLVADFAGECAGKVLFEREGLRWHSETSGEARQGTADDAQGGTGGSCHAFHLQQDPIGGDISPCIGGQHQATVGVVASFMGGQGAKAGGIAYSEVHAPTLRSAPSGTNTAPDVVYALKGNAIDRDTRQNGKPWSEGPSYTLDTTDRHGVCFGIEGDGNIRAHIIEGMSPCMKTVHPNSVVYDTTQITSPENRSNPRVGDPCHPLAAKQHPPLMVYPQVSGALCANSHPGSYTGQDAFNDMLPVVPSDKPPRKYIVRRLTPLECCRLQGFPDWWENGVQGSDSARYKMWGNGMALPCVAYVMEGIRDALMASWLDELLEDV